MVFARMIGMTCSLSRQVFLVLCRAAVSTKPVVRHLNTTCNAPPVRQWLPLPPQAACPLKSLMSLPTPRNPWIDACKGLACAAIVAHHLAFYGPMSDIAQPLAPHLMEWLYDYGRMAVQIFLVLGGYLAAASLAPQGLARFDSASQQITRRFVRLVLPYAVALLLAVLAAAAVRPWMEHDSVPDAPSLAQLMANALMLQDILGEDALSAGVWYVAIDFQLFALTTLLLAAVRTVKWLSPRQSAVAAQALVLAGTAASLWFFNRQPELDMWALYFWGSYGLGMLAYWAVRSARPGPWVLALVLLGAGALVLDFRPRIALAWLLALALVWLLRRPAPHGGSAIQPLQRLGEMSYSVFLVHFPVCLLANALFSAAWPDAPWMNALGMLVALVLSLAAGRLLYQHVERQVPSWVSALRWQAGLVGTGLIVARVGSSWPG